MRKFWLLVRRGLKQRIFKKSFIISNVVIFLVLMLVMNIPAIIQATASDSAEFNIYYYSEVINADDEDYDILNDYLMESAVLQEYDITFYKGTAKIENFFENDSAKEKYNGYLEILSPTGNLLDSTTTITLYDNFSSYVFGTLLSQELRLLKQTVSGIDNNVTVNYPPDTPGGDPSISMLISMIGALPLFIIIVMSIQLLGVDIVDEKSSKAIEIIIASVPAKTHFLAKVTSTFLYILIQTSIIVIIGLLGNLISMLTMSSVTAGAIDSSTIGMLQGILQNINIANILVFMLIFTLGGTVLYLVIAAFFASLSTTQEDYSQVQTPFMIFLLIGFYVAIFVPTIGEQAYGFLKVFAYIPFFAPLVIVGSYSLGVMSVLEVLISFLIMVATTVGLIFLIAPMYKVSILDYDGGKLSNRIKKAYNLSRKDKKK